ncbi:MAG TPA: efflux RND transporter permease subunit, partial [Bryobacteraceae bacterium]|nr:efflux RND transporter permease subunit [Bryobacteraceae bacterium]
LYGVSKFLFSALALAFSLSLLASFIVAMTVIPLFCSRFLKQHAPAEGGAEHPVAAHPGGSSWFDKFNSAFNHGFGKVLDIYEKSVRRALVRPGWTVVALAGVFILSLGIYPFLGVAFFPRTDAGQFTINLKAPTGTRIEVTEQYVQRVEDLIHRVVTPHDFKMVVSNIGVVDDFSSLYTDNAGEYTATVRVALTDDHKVSSFDYIARVREAIASQLPDVRTFFQSGSMVDAVINNGMPAPIDVQVSSSSLPRNFSLAQDLATRIRGLRGVGEVYIPQDMNYPGIRLDVDRVHAGELGLSQKDVVDNVITALNSNYMIAPNYWVDDQSGNDYYLTVQYFEHGLPAIHNILDLRNIPLRGAKMTHSTTLDTVVKLSRIQTPTEIDHHQIQRVADIYVTPAGEDLGRVTGGIETILKEAQIPSNVRVSLRGMVEGMRASFKSFGFGFLLSFLLLYLILVAQFRSFLDPVLIMLAIPMGFIGVLIILPLTHTTVNVMSLMGVLMLIGIAGSNSILIVDFAHRLEDQGLSVADAVITSCRVRLRPILMTSLATIIGMIPMALKLGTGAEQYTPMARAIIGGLASSVLLTVFIVPAAYLLAYGKKRRGPVEQEAQ